ncbi:MAG: hypothetical protein ACRDTM_13435 [Micromonosporaceae bacterium]
MNADDPEARLRSRLRDIREELVRVDAALDRYATAGEAEREPLWTDLKPVVDAEARGIDRRLAKVAELVEEHVHVAKPHSDAVTRIENLWSDVKRAWKTAPASIASVRRDIDRCVLEIGYLTVPERTNDNLDSLRVGGAMNFHEEFADEIPSKDARTLILKWLNAHPRTVTGVVDVPSGTIIRASRKRVRRMLSWALVLAVVALALVSAGFAAQWVKVFGVGTAPANAAGTDYVWAVLAAYGGAVLHIAIAALKQLRTSGGDDQRFTAIGNFTLWVHINEMYLMMYALAIPAVAYTVILSTGRIDHLTMAFVGFSIDSLLDVVLARFDKFSAGRTEAIAAAVK